MNPRAWEILTTLASFPADDPSDDVDLVCEGGVCYFGSQQVKRKTVDELLRCTAISISWGEIGGYVAFSINDTGRAIARRPDLEDEVCRALMRGGAFSIRNDQLVDISND
jgi:hypothetical protein